MMGSVGSTWGKGALGGNGARAIGSGWCAGEATRDDALDKRRSKAERRRSWLDGDKGNASRPVAAEGRLSSLACSLWSSSLRISLIDAFLNGLENVSSVDILFERHGAQYHLTGGTTSCEITMMRMKNPITKYDTDSLEYTPRLSGLVGTVAIRLWKKSSP